MRAKKKRFAELGTRDNVLEPGKANYETIIGNWRTNQFKNDNDLVIELACGKGEYTIGMSRLFPKRNFIGVDIKGDRIWNGSGVAIDEGLSNVAFLRTEITLLEKFFAIEEVNEIWITFPDPRPRDRDEKRRLTSNRFLDIYKLLLKKGGWVRLKTDSSGLFDYTLETLKARKDIVELDYTFDLYHSELKPECFDIRTKYEQKFNEQGHDIKYLKFRFME